MRDGLRAIHGAGPGEDEPTADAASGQPAARRGGNGTYDLSADDRRARHLSRRNGHSPVPRRAARRARVRQRDHCQAPAHTGASKVNHAVAV
jgi:hypothetical protein